MWGGFSAIGYLDGLELHFKETLKNQDERRHLCDNEHLDAAACVDGIKAFTQVCRQRRIPNVRCEVYLPERLTDPVELTFHFDKQITWLFQCLNLRKFSIEGSDIGILSLSNWDACLALQNLETKQVSFTKPDGNFQGYAKGER
jgi:hypothetical protein